jgi:DNA-binding Lrp family transcriptional regulator
MSETLASTGIDRAIIAATQEGLPLVERPFDEIARRIGLAAATVKRHMRGLQERGILRRIAAVPNHYALGWQANGMTVWDVDDGEIERLGPLVGALAFVTHCYRRPRIAGAWPYNLFAMVHGQNRAEVAAKCTEIAGILGPSCRAHDILYSTRILKKTGFRLSA